MFRHPYRYLAVLLLTAGCYGITVFCEVYRYFNIRVLWYHAFGTMLLITFLVWEGARLAERRLNKTALYADKVRYLIALFLAGCAITTIASAGTVYAVGRLVYGYNLTELYNPIKLNLIYGSLINLGLHLINAIFVYFDEYKRQWQEAEKLKRITAQAQVQLMRGQIKPHFLFNNLNVLAGMVVKDNPEANEFIEEFAKVYRYILKNHDKEVIELEKEIEFIQPYVYLLKKRFGDGLQVTINVPDHYHGLYIIPAALQMLIENAIKHNTTSATQPLRLDIHANGAETIAVTNNRQPRSGVTDSNKIGLQNIRQRYHLIGEREVEVQQSPDSFAVVLPLLHVNTVA